MVMHFPLPWATDLTVVIFGGLALFVHFANRVVAVLAPVFMREREEKDE